MSDNNDLSGAVEKLQSLMSSEEGQNQLQNIISMFAGGQSPEDLPQDSPPTPPTAQEQSPFNFDMDNMDMMLKMQRIMGAMNSQQGNNHTAFLHALKPYLKESRQSKLDSAVKLMGMAKAMEIFKDLNKEEGN